MVSDTFRLFQDIGKFEGRADEKGKKGREEKEKENRKCV